jgi:hypothetical protein
MAPSHNNAVPPKHSIICSNWKASYEFFDIGNADIETYKKRGWIEFVPEGGPPCIPFMCTYTSVAQNTAPKTGKNPKEFRRRVLDCGYDGGAYSRTVISAKTTATPPTSNQPATEGSESPAAIYMDPWPRAALAQRKT